MTFIANVIARDGVALVADSLVTTQNLVLDWATFLRYVNMKYKQRPNNSTLSLDPTEIIKLFSQKPIYTRNYEDKLFKIDKYSAVLTAGCAEINSKKIAVIVEEIVEKNKKLKTFEKMPIELKVKRFCRLIKKEIKDHLSKNQSISACTFFYTHFSKKTKQTKIFKILFFEASKNVLSQKKYKYSVIQAASHLEKVVHGGQNTIVEGIMFGDFFTSRALIQKVTDRLARDKKIKLTRKYIQQIKQELGSYDGINMMRLHDLSMQEATNLAHLLMRVELDFQKYTKDIPTVGGVIKLAIINKNGFKFIRGHEIHDPTNVV